MVCGLNVILAHITTFYRPCTIQSWTTTVIELFATELGLNTMYADNKNGEGIEMCFDTADVACNL